MGEAQQGCHWSGLQLLVKEEARRAWSQSQSQSGHRLPEVGGGQEGGRCRTLGHSHRPGLQLPEVGGGQEGRADHSTAEAAGPAFNTLRQVEAG